MRMVFWPAAAVALLTFCTPSQNERAQGGPGDGSETGMASGSGAGGLGSNDTTAGLGSNTTGRTGVDTVSPGTQTLSEADTASTGTTFGDNPAAPAAVTILSQLNIANTAEIQLSKKAAAEAESPQVKEIARKLVADHTKNRDKVQALAKQLNVDLLSAAGGALNPDTATVPPDLANKQGAEFDRAFVEHAIGQHEANIKRIQEQMLPEAKDPQLRQYLENTAAGMKNHLASLQQVQQQLGQS